MLLLRVIIFLAVLPLGFAGCAVLWDLAFRRSYWGWAFVAVLVLNTLFSLAQWFLKRGRERPASAAS